jgi:uncharacterized protein (DUF2235 family)
MSKNIAFCADGTWNGPGEPDTDAKDRNWTNVFKLFLNLAGLDSPDSTRFANEQERVLADGQEILQIAKYLHGVGDSDNVLVQALGGGFGSGVIARLVRGYTFVSRNYVPGDRIYFVGFSRGAYTARALAGLIGARGLLDASRMDLQDKKAAYQAGSKVWYDYRDEALKAKDASLRRRFEDIVFDLPSFISRQRKPIPLIETDIHAIAVWDTVGALGIPDFDDKNGQADVFEFADRKLGPKVKHARHAIAIDEQRASFTPTLWEADKGRIVQVLFPGAHADIGGGYVVAESGLSDGPLKWMTKELRNLGVRFSQIVAVPLAHDPGGRAHEPWKDLQWRFLPTLTRQLPGPPTLCLARAVLERLGHATLAPKYSPLNIAAYLDGSAVATGVQIAELDDPVA